MHESQVRCCTLFEPNTSGGTAPLFLPTDLAPLSADPMAPTSMGSPKGVPVPCTARKPTSAAASSASNNAALHVEKYAYH